jgi:hypothetical protein
MLRVARHGDLGRRSACTRSSRHEQAGIVGLPDEPVTAQSARYEPTAAPRSAGSTRSP